jgi:hypothetical protein
MQIPNELGGVERIKKVRARRVNSRVNIAVEWAVSQETKRAEGYTMDISPKGCLAIIPQALTVGQELRLVNLLSGVSCPALMIWRGHEVGKGWELGLELVNPPMDFWDLDF